MPFRPDTVVFHPDLEAAAAAWEGLARERRQPAQAVWKSLQSAISHIRLDGQWGEVIPHGAIPEYFVEKYELSNLYCVDLAVV